MLFSILGAFSGHTIVCDTRLRRSIPYYLTTKMSHGPHFAAALGTPLDSQEIWRVVVSSVTQAPQGTIEGHNQNFD